MRKETGGKELKEDIRGMEWDEGMEGRNMRKGMGGKKREERDGRKDWEEGTEVGNRCKEQV